MNNYIKKISIGFLSLFTLLGCTDFLEEEVYTQYDPNEFLKDQGGVDALLTGVYAQTQTSGFAARNYYQILNEFNTDISFESGGGLERSVLPIQLFNLNPSIDFINNEYAKYYSAIARANTVLDVTSGLQNVSQENIDAINAEARFLRAYSYYILHNLFGPTPIIEIPSGSSLDEIERIGKETPRASEEEYRSYVEGDLIFAAEKLKAGGVPSRASKGAAYALLAKFYLQNKEWQNAVNASDQVLALDYQLYADYPKMFRVDGEKNNKEYIFMTECLVGSNQANFYMAHAFPPQYVRQSNWGYFGAQYRVYTDFYESFEDGDTRAEPFLVEYTNPNTGAVTLFNRNAAGVALNNVRSFKYFPDPDAVGVSHGNDIPIIRLADIIMTKAEALNEINGPNQESIDLINQIRTRAHVATIEIGDYPTKESLNDFILAERGREFYDEGLRREDLIRHGKFISKAIARGLDAQPFHVLYPIPQQQLDNNPNLEQNPGYQ